MLKQELRKLRVDDIEKKKIREKRKDLSVKEQIIKKEQDDEHLLKNIRDREQILIATRHGNMMKNNMEKISHMEDLEKWVRRGFSTSRNTKKHVSLALAANPMLEQLSKQAQSPVKLGKSESQENMGDD